MKKEKTIKFVRDAYGKIAKGQRGCCGSTCGTDAKEFAKSIGYSEKDLKAIPVEANLALSCGNPIALAGLKKGEIVLDLGAGAGFDCFLAASNVGPEGKVIGVDMTPEMIEKARDNAGRSKVKNVEFRLGEIENLPLTDNSVDVAISNCVINLSADKQRVFQEIYRVLKPGGRIAVSDMALLKKLPEKVEKSMEAYAGCIAGAILVDEYKKIVEKAGFRNVKVAKKGYSLHSGVYTEDPIIPGNFKKGESLQDYVVSICVEGHK
ncbi:MAG: methyltransferase domain-containing protein [Nitrospiraceae bacterium]|nr:MAG: methyltransferase domain-containing protein [Nitrospiraceae bacterium]